MDEGFALPCEPVTVSRLNIDRNREEQSRAAHGTDGAGAVWRVRVQRRPVRSRRIARMATQLRILLEGIVAGDLPLVSESETELEQGIL